jgi:hypothetical protein
MPSSDASGGESTVGTSHCAGLAARSLIIGSSVVTAYCDDLKRVVAEAAGCAVKPARR